MFGIFISLIPFVPCKDFVLRSFVISHGLCIVRYQIETPER